MSELTLRVAIAKKMVNEGHDPRKLPKFTKAFFYEAMQLGAADIRKFDETPEQAFARFIETDNGQALRQAHQIAIGGDYVPSVKNAEKPSDGAAYDMLMAKAEELRQSVLKSGREPLTIEQAFAKIYESPENAALVARSRAEKAAQRRGETLPDGNESDAEPPAVKQDKPPALRKLMKKAKKLARKSLYTPEQALRRVCADPKNAELVAAVARERRSAA